MKNPGSYSTGTRCSLPHAGWVCGKNAPARLDLSVQQAHLWQHLIPVSAFLQSPIKIVLLTRAILQCIGRRMQVLCCCNCSHTTATPSETTVLLLLGAAIRFPILAMLATGRLAFTRSHSSLRAVDLQTTIYRQGYQTASAVATTHGTFSRVGIRRTGTGRSTAALPRLMITVLLAARARATCRPAVILRVIIPPRVQPWEVSTC